MSLIEKEELISSSIIKITNFVASHIDGKVLLMVRDAEVLDKKAEMQGTPISLASESSKGGKSIPAQPIKSDVVVKVESAAEAGPMAGAIVAENAMQAMVEAKAQLDASLAECKKAMEKYEKASRLFDEAMQAKDEGRKRPRV